MAKRFYLAGQDQSIGSGYEKNRVQDSDATPHFRGKGHVID